MPRGNPNPSNKRLSKDLLAKGRMEGAKANRAKALERKAFMEVFAEAAAAMGHDADDVRKMIVGKAIALALAAKPDRDMVKFVSDHLFGKAAQPVAQVEEDWSTWSYEELSAVRELVHAGVPFGDAVARTKQDRALARLSGPSST